MRLDAQETLAPHRHRYEELAQRWRLLRGQKVSEPVIQKIVGHLKAQGLVQRSSSALRGKRKRSFASRYAQPWSFKKYEERVVGERVQIDHRAVTKNGICVKHFQAWDPVSKFVHASVFSHASSDSAKKFLEDLLLKTPFTIRSIQVDGGSEFRDKFEKACQNLNIPLLVLPPRKPQYNGGVERTNRTLLEELYNSNTFLADTISAIQVDLQRALHVHNTYPSSCRLERAPPPMQSHLTQKQIL